MEWGQVLDKLKLGKDLTSEEASWAMERLMAGEATFDQFATFTRGLRNKGETTEEIRGLVEVMRERSKKVKVAGPLVDTAGTGGDGAGTINISTIAAIVMAGAGARVAKHGNRAASSKCGSADLLEELGVNLDPGPERVAECIDEAGIGFCFAPAYNPSMKHVAPFRKELGTPTIFNFLGPLTNPAGATHQVVGVSDAEMAPKMVAVLHELGSERVLAYQGAEGVDEITPWGTTRTWTIVDGEVEQDTLERDGGSEVSLEDIKGGDASVNASIAKKILDGEDIGAREVVVLNAAYGLEIGGFANQGEGAAAAEGSIASGKAKETLERLVEISNR